MSEILKNQLVYEMTEELIKKFDVEISKEVLDVLNKYLYNYDIIEKQTALVPIDSKTDKILKMAVDNLFIYRHFFILLFYTDNQYKLNHQYLQQIEQK